jgi:hypothetical protein
MGTGRRFATAPAPATTPERGSGASRTCRLGAGERWRGPLTTLKAARKPVPVRVEIIRVANGRGLGEDGAQCH